MSKLSISRCRPALVVLALAAATLGTGCITEVDDTTPTEPTVAQERHADTDREMAVDLDSRLEADADAERETESQDELVDGVADLAADIAAGQLTEREALLVGVIVALQDDDPEAAWADPLLQAVRPVGSNLPDIEAEEADFVDPGTPLQQGGQ
ncbi:MAG: hypothetical protein JRI68_20320 [Deltaproteobacteria bacterium]|nr:hypothetical protein [Deltaproteobacteria bacterium]